MKIKFLFMDEKFADQGVPMGARATSLTGILLEADAHPDFRAKFYTLVHQVLGDDPSVILPMPMVHAMDLFPGRDDEVRLKFLRGLVQVVLDIGIRVYRVGYRPTPDLMKILGNEPSILGLCFSGMLHCLETELAESAIWPVMEIDRSSLLQDRSFAGLVQDIDYMTARFGPDAMAIQNKNLGEVLYATKRSACGSLVDCIVYLLHFKFLRSIAHPLTPFKSQLADIAAGLDPAIAFDEIIEMKLEPPPSDYRPEGPFRYMIPIVPRD